MDGTRQSCLLKTGRGWVAIFALTRATWRATWESSRERGPIATRTFRRTTPTASYRMEFVPGSEVKQHEALNQAFSLNQKQAEVAEKAEVEI